MKLLFWLLVSMVLIGCLGGELVSSDEDSNNKDTSNEESDEINDSTEVSDENSDSIEVSDVNNDSVEVKDLPVRPVLKEGECFTLSHQFTDGNLRPGGLYQVYLKYYVMNENGIHFVSSNTNKYRANSEVIKSSGDVVLSDSLFSLIHEWSGLPLSEVEGDMAFGDLIQSLDTPYYPEYTWLHKGCDAMAYYRETNEMMTGSQTIDSFFTPIDQTTVEPGTTGWLSRQYFEGENSMWELLPDSLRLTTMNEKEYCENVRDVPCMSKDSINVVEDSRVKMIQLGRKEYKYVVFEYSEELVLPTSLITVGGSLVDITRHEIFVEDIGRVYTNHFPVRQIPGTYWYWLSTTDSLEYFND